MQRLVASIPALLVIGLIGCGNDSGNESKTESAAPKASARAQTVNVSETEFKLSPSNPRVKRGVVSFKVTNDGKVPHSLEVEGPGGEVELEKQLQPSQSGTLKVSLSKAGKYVWYCPVDGHKGSGMKGEVTVAGGGSAGAGGPSKSGDDSGGGSAY